MSIPAWHPEVVRELQRISGPRAVLTAAAALLAYENDGLRFFRHRPDCVVIPRNYEELKQLVRFCCGRDFPYLIRGAGTCLSGGPVAVQGGLIIHTSRLKNILEVNPEDLYCLVEPGVVLNRLNRQLESSGLFYPPDPSSGFSCTLGGNVAENAGGIRCFRYGVTANYVLGLEVILTTGETVRLGGPAGGLGRGNGCDWRALMIGSEGTLATIGKIWLRLKPLPEKIWTFLATFPDVSRAAAAITALVRSPATPVAIELVDNNMVRLVEASSWALGLDPDIWLLLVELDGPAELVDGQARGVEKILQAHHARSVTKTCAPAERLRLWQARKVGGGLVGRVSPDLMAQDTVIPRSRLAEILQFLYAEAEKEEIPILNFFHAGDGNLHPNFLFDARDPAAPEKIKRLGRTLMEKVVACGGALTGEHGIGAEKQDYIPLYFGAREIAMQRALLECFNPDHRLNPGKVFSGRTFVAGGTGSLLPVRGAGGDSTGNELPPPAEQA